MHPEVEFICVIGWYSWDLRGLGFITNDQLISKVWESGEEFLPLAELIRVGIITLLGHLALGFCFFWDVGPPGRHSMDLFFFQSQFSYLSSVLLELNAHDCYSRPSSIGILKEAFHPHPSWASQTTLPKIQMRVQSFLFSFFLTTEGPRNDHVQNLKIQSINCRNISKWSCFFNSTLHSLHSLSIYLHVNGVWCTQGDFSTDRERELLHQVSELQARWLRWLVIILCYIVPHLLLRVS